MPLSIEHGDLIVAAQSQLDSAALNELTLSSRMRVVPVMAQGQEIQTRQNEAYGVAPEGGRLSDPSDVRFEGIDVIEGRPTIDGDALSSKDVEFHESVHSANGPLVLAAIQRALHTVEQDGTIDIRIDTKNGMRTTRVRVFRAD